VRLYDVKTWGEAEADKVFAKMRISEGATLDMAKMNRLLGDWPELGREIVQQYWHYQDQLRACQASLAEWEDRSHYQMREVLLAKGEPKTSITAKLIAGALRLDAKAGPEYTRLEANVREMELATGVLGDLMKLFFSTKDVLVTLSNNLRAEMPRQFISNETQAHAEEVASTAARVRRVVQGKKEE
jgi:hypothetical protein